MPKFSGGTRIDGKGYLVIKAGPLRDERVHRVVAAAKIGRPLRKDEDVHHRDGDYTNPHPDNLIVMDKEIHGAVSARQHWYLKQHFKREDAAWKAYFDVTGIDYRTSSCAVQ